MTRRERVLASIEHREPDILPVGFKATDDVLRLFRAHFGASDIKGVLESLPVDTYGTFNNCLNGIEPRYVGGPPKVLYPNTYADGTWDSIYGYKRHWVPCTGGYNDEVLDHPLAEAQSIADLEKHDWPQADWFDYSNIAQQCEQVGDYAIVFNLGGLGHAENLVGIERHLTEMVLNPTFVEGYFQKLADFYVDFCDRILQAAAGRIDVVCMQDDFGTQQGPMISRDMFRRFYRPHLKRIFEVVHRHGAKVMMHSCGAVFDFIPDFIQIGADILDPIQTTAAGMDPARLREEFGRDLCFHGGIDTQKVLVTGTPQSVRDHIDGLVEALDVGGAFILAPSHYIQADAPWENIMAVFDHVKRWR